MNELEELLDKTTIEFPHAIDGKEAYKLLKGISENLDCRVYGASTEHYNFNSAGNNERYISDIKGTISYYTENSIVTTSFSFSRDMGEELGNFSGLKFFTPPGYDLDEIDSNEVELYDKVRGAAKKYFSEHPEPSQ